MANITTINPEKYAIKIKSEYQESDDMKEKMKVLAKLLSQRNNKNLLQANRNFFKLMGIPALSASEVEIQAYTQELRKTHRNLNTIRTYLNNLKKIFEIGVMYEIIPVNLVKRLEFSGFIKIPKPSESNSQILYVTKEKIDMLINSNKISKRFKAIVMFLSNTGCRESEFLGLKKSDIVITDKNTVHITMYMPKVDRNRIIKLNMDFYKYLTDNINVFSHYESNQESEYFFINKNGEQMTNSGLYKLLNYNWKKLYKTDKIGAHQFRHFFITYKVVVDKVNLIKVANMVGHRDVKTTMRYVHNIVTGNDFNVLNPDRDVKTDHTTKVVFEDWKNYAKDIEDAAITNDSELSEDMKSIFKDENIDECEITTEDIANAFG